MSPGGTVQGRLIYAHDDHQSYLDYYRVNRNVVGALLSWDITSRLKATVGYSRQQNNADGALWGALPLSYSDGTQIQDYPVSASTAADWTFWDVQDQSAFAELAYAFHDGWSAKGIVTYRKFDASAKLLYGYAYPDRDTGLGVFGSSGEYPDKYRQYLIDLYASGPYELFGRRHELAIGFSAGRSDGREDEGYSEDELDYPSYHLWGQIGIPEPSYPAPVQQVKTRDQLFRVYAATHLNFTDRLKGVFGFSAAKLETTGDSYGVDQSRLNSKASPYAGLLYDLTSNVTLYGSYTNIFNPQSQVDVGGRRLAPAVGYSYEAGSRANGLTSICTPPSRDFAADRTISRRLREYSATIPRSGRPRKLLLGGGYHLDRLRDRVCRPHRRAMENKRRLLLLHSGGQHRRGPEALHTASHAEAVFDLPDFAHLRYERGRRRALSECRLL